jgi:hypothetical protein
MGKFKMHLDAVLAEQLDDTSVQKDLVSIASELKSAISQWKSEIENAELRINHILEELNSSLGREIRKIQPKMAISLRNGACTCGYRSRDLSCKPDLDKGIWQIGGALGGGFRRRRPEALRLSHDLKPLAQAVVDHFRNYYRTLS